VQEEGGPVREYGPRQAFTTAPGVRHWHGSRPNEPLKQVAMSFGMTNWMEKVTEAQYSAAGRK
jgi:quercetin dioxygenase-like cupin family protein